MEFFVPVIIIFFDAFPSYFGVPCVSRRVFVVVKVGSCFYLDLYVVLLGKKSLEAKQRVNAS